MAYPNTVITLSQPLSLTRLPKSAREVREISLGLHDPAGFRAAVAAAGG